MPVIYHYYRYHSPEEEEMDNLIEALRRVCFDMEWNTASPEKIVLEDGTTLGRDAILEQSGWWSETGVMIDSTLAE